MIGVAPANFLFLPTGKVALWIPVKRLSPEAAQNRQAGFVLPLGRMKEGVSLEQTQAEMQRIALQLGEEYPDTNEGRNAVVRPAFTDWTEPIELPLLILLGAVCFVLVIACVNVANLLLARAAARRREVGIRIALGASRGRLIRQLLVESMVLATVGGASGLLLTVWVHQALPAIFLPAQDAAFYVEYFDFGMNGSVFFFTAGVALGTGVLFGLVPGLATSKPEVYDALKEGGAAGVGRKRHWVLSALVVTQVALAVVLLIGAGLLIRGFQRVQKVDFGFDPESVLCLFMQLPEASHPETAQVSAFYERLLERLNAMDGIEAAGLTTSIPFSFAPYPWPVVLEGRDLDESIPARTIVTTPGYLEALRMPLLQGQPLTDRYGDRAGAVALVNQTMARRCWPGEDPLGKRFNIAAFVEERSWFTVVGVVGDVRYSAFESEPYGIFYVPMAQSTQRYPRLVVRSSIEPQTLVASIEGIVADLEPDLPLSDIQMMETMIEDSLWINAMSMTLLSVFAGVALMLSAVGVYGVIDYSVAQRKREFGIRMALGAQRLDILKMVFRQALKLILIGMGIGIAAAFGLTRLLDSLLYGVDPLDPLTFGGVALLIGLIALLACYVPARRAMGLNPVAVLDEE